MFKLSEIKEVFSWLFMIQQPVPIKTEYQQQKESGILLLQQKAEDRYWDSYIEEQAQKAFEEYKNAPVIKIGDKEYKKPNLIVPDLPVRCYYTEYDWEHPENCKYHHGDPRELIGKRYNELVKEFNK